MSHAWLDAENAHIYDSYTHEFDMYQKLALKLVERAEIRRDMIVADLACGTGVVTKLLVSRLATTSNIFGIDISAPMLEIAQRNCPAVRFIHSPAERLHEILPSASVDVVLCNSAFWMMRCSEVLSAIYSVLKPGGRFLFNLPDFIFSPVGLEAMPLLTLMSKIAREEYGYTPPPLPPPPLDDDMVQSLLKNASFSCLLRDDEFVLERSSRETYALGKIPAVSSWLCPEQSYQQRMELLDEAYARYDKTQKDIISWRFYMVLK